MVIILESKICFESNNLKKIVFLQSGFQIT